MAEVYIYISVPGSELTQQHQLMVQNSYSDDIDNVAWMLQLWVLVMMFSLIMYELSSTMKTVIFSNKTERLQ